MKRKKTLPADFEEILKRGDVEEIRGILEQCEEDAHKPYEKETVLFFAALPEEIIRYLVVERGADINQSIVWTSKYGFGRACIFTSRTYSAIY